MEKILNKILGELTGLKQDVGNINKKVDTIDARLDTMDVQLDTMETRLNHLETGQKQIMDRITSFKVCWRRWYDDKYVPISR